MPETGRRRIDGDLAGWTQWLMESPGRQPPQGDPPVELLRVAALGPAVSAALRRQGDERAAAFEPDYLASTATNVVVLDLASRVREWLGEVGISFVAIKGMAGIARFWNGDPGFRPMADADLLIEGPRFGEAVDLLVSQGLDRVKPPHPLTDRWASSVLLRARRGMAEAMVDVHRSLHNWPLAASFSPWILENRELVDGWPVPAIPGSLLVIALHRFRHSFIGDAREIFDAARLLEHACHDTWAETLAAARRFDLSPALYVVVRQVVRWFSPAGLQEERLATLRGSIGAARAAALDRLIPDDAGIVGNARLPGGFVGQYVAMLMGTTRLLPPAVAMTAYVGSRLADEIVTVGGSGLTRTLATLIRPGRAPRPWD